MPMEIRGYQQDCRLRVRQENTIINMPTGTGKTLVAVLAIDDFRSLGKIMFIVPTLPLVEQQADYVKEHAAEPISVKKIGNNSASRWEDIVKSNDVLVGTPEVFRHALVDSRSLRIQDFSLVIFDECHNATGNSPMAAILRDAIHRCEDSHVRILGLTASFANGGLKEIEQKRKDIEGLMQATMFVPDVEERKLDFEQVSYEPMDVSDDVKALLDDEVQRVLQPAQSLGVPLTDLKSIFSRGHHVYTELGLESFLFYVQECIVPQVRSSIQKLDLAQEGVAGRVEDSISQLRKALCDAAELINRNPEYALLPRIADKAKRLVNLLLTLRTEDGQAPRVIIFCEQTVLATPLAKFLEDQLGRQVVVCTGTGTMTEGVRKQNLELFKNGTCPVMTCTAAVEEGLDVSECQFVIRYSEVATAKSHIQGAGRARKLGAKVYYFDNDWAQKVRDANKVQETAKETRLSLTAEEMDRRRQHNDVEGVHPYRAPGPRKAGAWQGPLACLHAFLRACPCLPSLLPPGGAEISVFNCVPLVNQYAQRTMGQSFRPEESILEYQEEEICRFPQQTRKRLCKMTVPSPDGFLEVHASDVDEMWGEFDLKDVAEEERMKKWTGSDKEMRRFYYVVAVHLSKKGYLDAKNEPSARAIRETPYVCRSFTMSEGLKIGVKFDPRVDGGSAFRAQEAVSPLVDYKSQLNERVSKALGGWPEYETVDHQGGFTSTVKLPNGQTFQADGTASSKKAAEQRAAEKAMLAMEALPRESERLSTHPSRMTAGDGMVVSQPPVAPAQNAVQAPILDPAMPTTSPQVPVPALGTVALPTPVQAPAATNQGPGPASPRSNPGLSGTPTSSPGLPRTSLPSAPASSQETNHKGRLNEWTITNSKPLPIYNTPPGLPGGGFTSTVQLGDGRCFEGTGSSKKAAEQSAAAKAMQAIDADSRTAAAIPAAPPPPAAATQQPPAPAVPGALGTRNYKGELNEKFPDKVTYRTLPAEGGSGFRSTVSLVDGRSWQSDVMPSKKEAERNAAQAACEALARPGQPVAVDIASELVSQARLAHVGPMENLLSCAGLQGMSLSSLEEKGLLKNLGDSPNGPLWAVVKP